MVYDENDRGFGNAVDILTDFEIIIANEFFKILKTLNVLWFFVKSENKKKILKFGYILQANIYFILV